MINKINLDSLEVVCKKEKDSAMRRLIYVSYSQPCYAALLTPLLLGACGCRACRGVVAASFGQQGYEAKTANQRD